MDLNKELQYSDRGNTSTRTEFTGSRNITSKSLNFTKMKFFSSLLVITFIVATTVPQPGYGAVPECADDTVEVCFDCSTRGNCSDAGTAAGPATEGVKCPAGEEYRRVAYQYCTRHSPDGRRHSCMPAPSPPACMSLLLQPLHRPAN
ncbi:hypothetical protein FHG87_013645 [Trinorchestia longiramus]|nr:hypothetical protein FHG87_013645 [Trinorchestia longiramus]